MIVETSAAVAILRREPEAAVLLEAIRDAPSVRMSVASIMELSIVATERLRADVDLLLVGMGVDPLPIDGEQLRVAREAHYRYGHGSGSPARLDFGDCFSYAASVCTGEPLLYKGEDFVHTDVVPAVDPT